MNSFIKQWFLLSILFMIAFSIFGQSSGDEVYIEKKSYNSTNYVRSNLFKEQDLIYGRTVLFNQGLELICYQDKVKVDISGFDTLYTPVDLNNIPAGDYSVKLSKTGYYPSEFRITISSDERTSIFVNLVQYTTLLSITGLPDNAVIYLNNHRVESNTIEVPRGENSLRISAFGYEDYTEIIDISNEKEVTFTPELIKREFSLSKIEVSRDTIWLNDSNSQKKSKISIYADAPGTGVLTIINESDNRTIIDERIIFDKARTDFIFDVDEQNINENNTYKIIVTADDGKNFVELSSSIEVKKGTKSIWRNNFSGFSGFLFSPSAETLPKGRAQIQTIVTPVFDSQTFSELYVPSSISVRTSIIDNLEITLGISLYISPDVNETSLDLFTSGKYNFISNDGSDGFSMATGLSINYIGKTNDYVLIPAYDPYAGLSGVSLILPLEYRLASFLFVFTPEIKFSPSYPGTDNGGFSSGSFYIWNYLRAAISIDLGEFSTSLSAALQSPSYINRNSEKWPFFVGLEFSSTPGETGFSFSLFGGLKYTEGESLKVSSGISAGFIF